MKQTKTKFAFYALCDCARTLWFLAFCQQQRQQQRIKQQIANKPKIQIGTTRKQKAKSVNTLHYVKGEKKTYGKDQIQLS